MIATNQPPGRSTRRAATAVSCGPLPATSRESYHEARADQASAPDGRPAPPSTTLDTSGAEPGVTSEPCASMPAMMPGRWGGLLGHCFGELSGTAPPMV